MFDKFRRKLFRRLHSRDRSRCGIIYEKPAAPQGVRVRHACLRPKRHEHAVVIPVLNEGEPVGKQLQRIHAATPAVDIIIADGSSTDSSLQEDFLAAIGVRALLVKRGPGRAGAQMRMAYASALDETYVGIDKSIDRLDLRYLRGAC